MQIINSTAHLYSDAPQQTDPACSVRRATADYAYYLLSDPGRRMLLASGRMESSNAGLDNRHRNKDGEISHKHGNCQ